jgi:catechol 2,3-dioxygenase-like lactoylglutathione lyase family enzyme
MVQLRRIGHATFETSRMEKATAYYTEVMGLTPVGHDGGRTFLATQGGRLSVVLEPAAAGRCAKLSFEVATGDDLPSVQAQLALEGVTSEIRSDPAPGIDRTLCFVDPNGTMIELFASPGSIRQARDAGGVGPLKLGHVAFYTPDPGRMAKFYQGLLGFRISDWVEDFFVFMRCNADHHTVNFLRGDRPRMHHIAFELRDAAHVCRSCDVLASHAIPIEWGPIRLGPGHNVATFHREHDAQLVELYAELDQMKDEVLGYYDPRPWHRDTVQRPKVWKREEDPVWGPSPPDGFL